MGAVVFLQIGRAAKVIRVAMRDQNHLYLRRIEAQLLHAL
jgi:hypothetical protein